MSWTLVLVCEGGADAADLRALTTRVIEEEHDWVRGITESVVTWWHPDGSAGYVSWTEILKLAAPLTVPPVHGESGSPVQRQVLRLARAIQRQRRKEHCCVVFVHDGDRNASAWAEGIAAGISAWKRHEKDRLAFGIAQPEHEAWVLAGYSPEGETETANFAALRKRLGFDPCEQSERLTSAKVTDPNDAKRALDELRLSKTRREEVLERAPLERLRARGQANGLKDFLDAIREKIAPL